MENKDFPFRKVSVRLLSNLESKEENMRSEEAEESLQSIDDTRREVTGTHRAPLAVIGFGGFTYALIVFGWGMSEHENLWALAMYIGGAGFFLTMALYYYTFRIMGIKLRVLPGTKSRAIFEFMQVIFFTAILVGGRELRLAGFDYAPHVAALIAGVLICRLLYKYPMGERLE